MPRETGRRTRPIDNPYQICNEGSWQWRVLKHYQTAKGERNNRQYARVFCAVSSPYTYGDYDYGDVYCHEIPGYSWDWDDPLVWNRISHET